MKKILVALALLAVTGTALAQHHGHDYRHYGQNYYRNPGNGWWVAPLVVGAISYELVRQRPVVVQQPVVVQNAPIVTQQTCTPWTETYSSDGTITRTRTCQ